MSIETCYDCCRVLALFLAVTACSATSMDDEEDQETPFQEMDAHQLAVETAWVRLFLREASTRGYTLEDIITLLDEPGMTVEAAVERILSTRNGEPSQPPKTTHGEKAK